MQFDEMDEVEYIWMDGSMEAWDDANIHVLSHGLHYGTSIFEGIRAYDTDNGTALFRLEDHFDRFFDSAQPYGMNIPYDKQTLIDASTDLLDAQSFSEGYVRPVAFYGYGMLGLTGDCPLVVAIAAWPWGRYMGDDALEQGITAKVASWEKFSSNAFPTTAKTGGAYANSFLATNEAQRDGYDEAILLNNRGTVAEGPGENIFLVNDGELYTPPLSDDLLSGVTRDTICSLADDLGYPVNIQSIARGELYTADEVFFTGTAAEVTPVVEVDNVSVTNGIGPITKDIQETYFDVVRGRASRYDHWLTYV